MPRKNRSHLTLSERIAIEDGLREGSSLNAIARSLGVCRTTVVREIKRRRTQESPRYLVLDRNLCRFKSKCTVMHACRLECDEQCSRCPGGACNAVCNEFEPIGECPLLDKAPYACNGCGRRLSIGCQWPQWFYDARVADEEARWDLSVSRSGIDCSEEELRAMCEIVKPLLRKGQSLQHIWQKHYLEMPVSYRTFYRYVNLGILDVINLDLPKKVKYRPRRKGKANVPFKPNLLGRTYEDFAALTVEQQWSAVEMDCVVPARGGVKAILTLHFRRICFQIMILLPAQTAGCVKEALDWIEMLCGKEQFQSLFGTILTDRGTEFMSYSDLETGIDGNRRCHVYYCDPLQSGQKGRCEKNHVELRKILPKGMRFDAMTNDEMAVICSHVNSYGRPALGGASPFDLAEKVLPRDLLDGLALRHVPPDDVIMRPTLLRQLGIR